LNKKLFVVLLLIAILLFPPVIQLWYKTDLFYFQILLYCCSFSFLIFALLVLFKKTKGFFLYVINLLIFVLFVCCLEFFFGFLNQRSPSEKIHYNTDLNTGKPGEMIDADTVLGYKLKPNLHFSTLLTINGDSTYNSTLHSSPMGWRSTPFHSTKNKSAVFLGCSYTFGEGVNDEQTLPWIIGENSDYNSYNLAFLGYGPQQSLLSIKSLILPPAEKTKVFYVYIDGHIQRINGNMMVVNSYGKNFPYPEIEGDSLVMYPSFEKKSPVLSPLYSALKDCQTMQYFNLDLPLIHTGRHFELCGKTIEELAKAVGRKYQSPLIVVIYPGSLKHQEVLTHVDKKLITVLDYSSFCEKGNEKYFFKTDGHPNALLNKIIANRILKDIFR
jgi:ABC-type transport system involved in multi-copper enzyme maturation permease subunit